MTLADRSSHRARRTVRSSAKPGHTARSTRDDVDLADRRAAHGLPLSGDPILQSNQHPLFVTLIRKFGEFLFELDASGKFVTAWTSRNALLQKRRASVFGRRPGEVFGFAISRAWARSSNLLFATAFASTANSQSNCPPVAAGSMLWLTP